MNWGNFVAGLSLTGCLMLAVSVVAIIMATGGGFDSAHNNPITHWIARISAWLSVLCFLGAIWVGVVTSG